MNTRAGENVSIKYRTELEKNINSMPMIFMTQKTDLFREEDNG